MGYPYYLTAHSPFLYSFLSHISHCQAGSTTLYKFKPWSSMTMWPSLSISFRWFLVNLTCVIAVVIQLAHNLRFPDLNCTNFPISFRFIVKGFRHAHHGQHSSRDKSSSRPKLSSDFQDLSSACVQRYCGLSRTRLQNDSQIFSREKYLQRVDIWLGRSQK